MSPWGQKAEDQGFHFPLYIYQNFYELKDVLKKPDEQKLYSAFEEALLGHYDVCCDIAAKSNDIDTLKLRVLKFPISENSYEYIITNLPMYIFSLETIKDVKRLISRYLVLVRLGRSFERNLRRQEADPLGYR